MPKPRGDGRPKARHFVTIGFATKSQPNLFTLVYRAARLAQMPTVTYIRDRVGAAARTELAQHRQAQERDQPTP